MRSETKTISPEEAAELPTRNESNRPLSKTVVSGFASAMRRGEWKLTHQGIALGQDGQVVDGQHRLSAIVESGVPTDDRGELTGYRRVARYSRGRVDS